MFAHGARGPGLVEWTPVGFVTNTPGEQDDGGDLDITVSLPGELYDPEPGPDGPDSSGEGPGSQGAGTGDGGPGRRVGGVSVGDTIELSDAPEGDGGDDLLVVELDEWSEVARAAAEERLRESGIPHWWVGTAVHGSVEDAAAIDEVLDEIDPDEPDPLDPDEDQVAYDMSEWDDDRLATLGERLDEAEVPFAWDGEGEELFVYARDEDKVDELIEAVEHPDELAVDATEPEPDEVSATLMGDMFVAADRLQHDPKDHEQAALVLLASEKVSPDAPPYGLDAKDWGHLCERVEHLAATLDDDDLDEEAVVTAAKDLRTSLRPYV